MSKRIELTEGQLRTIRETPELTRDERRALRRAAERGEIPIPEWMPPEEQEEARRYWSERLGRKL